MARTRFKDIVRFLGGFILERPDLDVPYDYAASGSRNVLYTGQGEPVPFKGLTQVSGIGGIYASPVGGLTPLGPTFTLTVSSSNPSSGVSITVSPADVDGNTDGTT